MSEYLSWAFFWKFIKFGIVGGSGVFVDFGFTYVCKEWLKIPKYIANAIGFSIAASSNYLFNRIWTFQSKDPEVMIEFAQFFAISIIGLCDRCSYSLEFLCQLFYYVWIMRAVDFLKDHLQFFRNTKNQTS